MVPALEEVVSAAKPDDSPTDDRDAFGSHYPRTPDWTLTGAS
jgi:hypothetical protein